MKKSILFLILGIFAFSLIGGVLAQCTGGADLQISHIDITPTNNLNTTTFKVYATVNGNGDCLNIAWTKDQLNQLINQQNSSLITNKSIIGNIQLISQTETFPTKRDSLIYNYTTKDEGIHLLRSCSDVCAENNYSIPISPSFLTFGTCYCVNQSEGIGATASFTSSKSLNDQVEISISGLPKETFNTSEGSADIGGKMQVAFVGNFLGTKELESPATSNLNPFEEPNGSYLLVSGDGNQANSFLSNLLDEINGSHSINDVENAISSYGQNIYSSFLTNKLSGWISDNSAIVNRASFVGSNLVVSKNIYATNFPQITLTFNAAWAGVHWITGQPKVTCPSDTSFTSGDTKTLSFNVKNVASEPGAFSLDLNCGNVSSTLANNKANLGPENSTSISATVTASTNNERQESCTFKAYATRDPSKSAQCSFNLDLKPAATMTSQKTNSSPITGAAVNSVSGSSSSSKFPFWIFIIIGVLLAGAVGFFILNKKSKAPVGSKSNKKEAKKESNEKSSGKHCTECGAPLKEGSKFCTKCGKRID